MMKQHNRTTNRRGAKQLKIQKSSAPKLNAQRGLGVAPMILPILAQFTAQPDGTFHMKPQMPDGGMDVWITPAQACNILGIKGAAIYRLVDPAKPFLVWKRPLPRKILISLRSVTALSEATKNAEFWESEALQEKLRAKLRQIAASGVLR
jgi:hypothetical protein